MPLTNSGSPLRRQLGFPTGWQPNRWAVRALSLDSNVRESLGLVGESGSGKSTLARLICALEPPTTGRTQLRGADLSGRALGGARSQG